MADQTPTEKLLFDAMDQAALSFVAILTNTTGKSIPLKEKTAVFRLAMDWLVKSQRIKPETPDDLPRGVKDMKQLIDGAPALAKPKPATRRKYKTKTPAQKLASDDRALAKAMRK